MGRGVGIEDADEIVHSVLRVAERVRFSIAFNKYQERILSVGGVLGVYLRTLKLPHACAYPEFFVVLLSHCPGLQSLVIKGEPIGSDPIHISHTKLEKIEVRCRIDRLLTIDCLNLTRLSTAGDGDHMATGTSGTKQIPSFRCPNLTSLFLSCPVHCVSGILESMAAHAPKIEWLESYCRVGAPFEVLYNFKALQGLKLRECQMTPLGAFDKWSLLERLTLHGDRFESNVREWNSRLKCIKIDNRKGLTSPSIFCVSLEELFLEGFEFGEEALEDLNMSCPNLKRLHVEGDYDNVRDPRAQVAIEIKHERLLECTIINLSHRPNSLVCPKLVKLVVDRDPSKPCGRFSAHCASLTSFELSGALNTAFCMGILSTLQDLRELEISRLQGIRGNDTLELKHSNIRDVVIRCCKVTTIVLKMEHVERVEVVNSCVEVLKVFSVELVTLELTNCMGLQGKAVTMLNPK